MAKRYQNILHFDEDRHIRPSRIAIEASYLVNDKTKQAWHLIHEALMPYPELGCMFCLVSSRTDVPLSPFKPLKDSEQQKVANIQAIAHENLQRRRNKSAEDGKKNYNAQLITIALVGAILVFMVVAIMAMYPRTGFKIPWS